MKKQFIWIVLFVALVLLFAFLFLWPIQGSLYLNMNEDDGLNSSVYDLSTNRSKKVVIDDYNEVIDYYPLTGGYAAIGVNYVRLRMQRLMVLRVSTLWSFMRESVTFLIHWLHQPELCVFMKTRCISRFMARTMLPHVTTSATCLILVLKIAGLH